MIKIKTITLKNFLSVGAVTQSINLDNSDLTLILGENLDLGGEGEGARNGVGKTTLLQALSYGLYGVPINSIKRDNLINRTNEKAMLVSIDFSVSGIDYRIVRGRKPNILKFYINSVEQQNGESEEQGENRETQTQIESILCMSSDMFQHIIGLNSYTTPFLSLKAADQRAIIEQLLGITILSEKAEAIKELNRTTKEAITQEEYRLKGVEEANRRITEQISSLQRRSTLWLSSRNEAVSQLVERYDTLNRLDIESELRAHTELERWTEQKRLWDARSLLLDRQGVWREAKRQSIAELQSELSKLDNIDIEAELRSHSDLILYNERVKQVAELERVAKTIARDIKNATKNAEAIAKEISELQQHRCYACGQDFHDDNHSKVLAQKHTQRSQIESELAELVAAAEQNSSELAELVPVGKKPSTHYATQQQAYEHNSEVVRLQKQIADKEAETDPYSEQISEITVDEPAAVAPLTHYPTQAQAFEHSSTVISLRSQIDAKRAETDPYTEQIVEMQQNALQELDYSHANSLTVLLQHQEYLLDLLTNKKSFVRKKIIEQNLGYLNVRLSHYLGRMGLPHSVIFQNDLTVDITDFGRDCDFDSLSRGERNRLILSLSFAFRDVWENLYSSVNMLFIDELMDSGMDSAGVENGLHLLKDFSRNRNKSVWLVSHRDELVARVSNILKVVKENGYTTFATADEI